VYIPQQPTAEFESFAAPILNCIDAHVAAPFFGPNYWTSIVQPVPGGNVPAHVPALEVKMTFKEGGAYDFASTFERIKERLAQVVENARESGQMEGREEDLIDLGQVHLDELPTYEQGSAAPPIPIPEALPTETVPSPITNASRGDVPPTEPPRYEDVQRISIANELERRTRRESQ
jgi:hypothetical protein